METKDLDISKIKVPEGYKVIIDPELIEKERKAKEKKELEDRLAEMLEPTDKELIEYAKMFHPYYDFLRRLND
jgi:hypothetical protein